jgi:hypothetical protein
MDTKTLIKEAKARFDHNSAKQLLKEKYQQKLIVANQSGLWKASPEIIGYLSINTSDTVFLVDSYENPLLVNRVELLDVLYKTYNDTMALWHEELKELRQYR